MIYHSFEEKDIKNVKTTLRNLVSFDLSSYSDPSLTALDPLIDTQVATEPSQIYNILYNGSLSSYYNSLKWYLYEKSGSDNIEKLSGTSSTSSFTANYIKVITIPRETAKERLVANTLSATFEITTLLDSSSGTWYCKDEPILSTSGTDFYRGRLKMGLAADFTPSASLTSVGEVFYNYGTLLFRGSDVGVKSLSSFIDNVDMGFVDSGSPSANTINIINFQFRREETKMKSIFFCRALNDEFNYSNNPTYVNSDGSIKQSVLDLGEGLSYISTVGIYDDENNLLAVANINPVEKKDFENECLFKVAITY